MTLHSYYYAPNGTCNKCGFTGKDWAFKYQGLCSKCYKQWKKQKAAELKAHKPKNENIRITDKLIVTRNVRDSLLKQSHADIPFSLIYKAAEKALYFGIILLIIPIFLSFLGVKIQLYLWLVFSISSLLIFLIGEYFENIELKKRMPLVNKRLEQLANERQKQIGEAKRFYGSPEWRLLRKKIMKAHKNVCKSCGKIISEKNDITIDHILPRSKFPESALGISNLQVLCRPCNSSKGNKIIDS